MRRALAVLATTGTLLLAGAALAADPAGVFTQVPGPGGCITDDGRSNGVPSACTDGRGLADATAVALSPDNRFAYAYGATGTIAVLARDPVTGALSQVAGTGACLGGTSAGGDCTDGRLAGRLSNSAHAIAVTGDHVFMAGRSEEIVASFDRDGATGALSEPAGPAACVSGDGRDADATEDGCTRDNRVLAPQSLAVSPDGRFLYAGGSMQLGLRVFSIDASGALTALAGDVGCHSKFIAGACLRSRLSSYVYDIALSPDGSTLYAVNIADSAVLAYRRDATTGELAQIDGPGGCVRNDLAGDDPVNPCADGRALADPESVEVSPDGRLVTVGTGGAGRSIVVLRRAADGSLSQPAGAAGCVNEDGSQDCGRSRLTRNVYRTLVAPDGRSMVAAAYGDAGTHSGLAFFDLAADGTLSQRDGTRGCMSDTGADSDGTPGICATGRGLAAPIGLAATADGRWLYASSVSDDGLAAFRLPAAPVCSDASAETAFGTAVTVPVACSDADGDALTLSLVDGPSNGTVAISGSSVTYTPAAGSSGTDSLKVRASDGVNDGAPATVSVTVAAAPAPGSPAPDPPPAAPARVAPQRLTLKAKPRRDRSLPLKFRFNGRLVPAPGAACSGKVVVKLKLGRRTAAKKAVPLPASCKWRAAVKVKDLKKLGNRSKGTLKVKARFAGSDAMTSKSATPLTVRFG